MKLYEQCVLRFWYLKWLLQNSYKDWNGFLTHTKQIKLVYKNTTQKPHCTFPWWMWNVFNVKVLFLFYFKSNHRCRIIGTRVSSLRPSNQTLFLMISLLCFPVYTWKFYDCFGWFKFIVHLLFVLFTVMKKCVRYTGVSFGRHEMFSDV